MDGRGMVVKIVVSFILINCVVAVGLGEILGLFGHAKGITDINVGDEIEDRKDW